MRYRPGGEGLHTSAVRVCAAVKGIIFRQFSLRQGTLALH